MNNPIRHIAGPYEDGVQQCTRCLKILVDHRNANIPESERRSLQGFNEGPVCILGKSTFVDYILTDAVDCEPMGNGP